MPRPPFIDPNYILLELVFSAIVIMLALLIYFRTKEMYSLTRHKGISYFRNAFLFFALAYFFRLGFHFFRISRFLFEASMSRHFISPASLVLTGYLSTMAIFFLVLSTLWKKADDKRLLFIINFFAIAITFLTAIFRTPEILAAAQLILLAFAIMMSYFSYKNAKRHSELFIIYILMSIIWVLNIFALGTGPLRLMSFELRLVAPAVCIVLFSIIYFKVSKWAK